MNIPGWARPGALAVAATEAACVDRAAALAARLGLDCLGLLPVWRACATHARLVLVAAQGVSLGATGAVRSLPVSVDFADPGLQRRLRQGGARRESVARALGLPAPRAVRIVDATAGLGRDSAVLAALGCQVLMIERNPVVAALLEDGLRRARASEDARVREMASRLAFRPGDAAAALRDWPDAPPDAVLLDPMFPERVSSAAVRKEMRLFQELVGDDEDAPALLAAALARAAFRVAVKRPLAAPVLAGPAPSHSLRGSSTRFDVYVRARIV